MIWFDSLSGTVNTIKINGTELTLQPTTIKWMSKPVLDISGDGHPVYPAIRECELRWGLMDLSSADQIQDQFATIGTTGTAVITLPPRVSPSSQYREYSGVVLYEPEWGEFYDGNPTSVVLRIGRIRE